MRFSDDARDIRLLQGEAPFTVRRDAARPFRVWTDTAVVQAVGTAFNVYRRADHSTLVSVVEGRVKVAASAKVETKTESASHKTDRASAPQSVDQTAATPLSAGEEASVLNAGEILKQPIICLRVGASLTGGADISVPGMKPEGSARNSSSLRSSSTSVLELNVLGAYTAK